MTLPSGWGRTTPLSRSARKALDESTADQVDRLADIIDEFLTMAEAGVPMSATTRQQYAAEMAELRGQRAQLRKTIADFWVQIGRKAAQSVTASAAQALL